MHYYYIHKATNKEGQVLAERDILTSKQIKELSKMEDVSYSLPAFFQNKAEMEAFMNKETPFNIYISQSVNNNTLSTQIVVTYTQHPAVLNDESVELNEVKIDEFNRTSVIPEGDESSYTKFIALQASSVLIWFIMKKGYKHIRLFDDAKYDIFYALNRSLSDLDPYYESFSQSKYESGDLSEMDETFIRFIKKLLATYPTVETVVEHVPEDDIFIKLTAGLAAEKTGEDLPNNYGTILSFVG